MKTSLLRGRIPRYLDAQKSSLPKISQKANSERAESGSHARRHVLRATRMSVISTSLFTDSLHVPDESGLEVVGRHSTDAYYSLQKPQSMSVA